MRVVDWDPNSGRTQTFDLLDAASEAVLSTQTVSDFSGGKYLVFDVKGSVKLRFTTLAVNAVLSGLFLDAVPSAAFVSADAATQGAWKGKYGAQGVVLAGDASTLPSSGTFTATGDGPYAWAASTSDPPARYRRPRRLTPWGRLGTARPSPSTWP